MPMATSRTGGMTDIYSKGKQAYGYRAGAVRRVPDRVAGLPDSPAVPPGANSPVVSKDAEEERTHSTGAGAEAQREPPRGAGAQASQEQLRSASRL